MALTNVIALHHLPDARRIGHVRVWGTVGWVAISWSLSAYLGWREGNAPAASHLGDGLLVAAALAVATGLYCLRLPHTPPGASGAPRRRSLVDGFRLLAHSRAFAVLFVVSFAVAASRPFFYNLGFLFFTDSQGLGLSSSAATLVMSLGSMASIVAVEALAPARLRASAQALLVFVNSGLGALVGHALSGRVYDHYALPGGGRDWTAIYTIPALAATAAAGLLLFAFRTPSR